MVRPACCPEAAKRRNASWLQRRASSHRRRQVLTELPRQLAACSTAGARHAAHALPQASQLLPTRRRRPHSLVLLERIDRAHPEVLSLVIQVKRAGRRCTGSGGSGCRGSKVPVWQNGSCLPGMAVRCCQRTRMPAPRKCERAPTAPADSACTALPHCPPTPPPTPRHPPGVPGAGVWPAARQHGQALRLQKRHHRPHHQPHRDAAARWPARRAARRRAPATAGAAATGRWQCWAARGHHRPPARGARAPGGVCQRQQQHSRQRHAQRARRRSAVPAG